MAKKETKIEVKAELTGINKIRKDLKDVKDELADALAMDDVNPDKIIELTEEAAKLKDQLGDINEQVDVFASGSRYEQASKGLGSVGKALKNLDFEKASSRAQSFAKSAGKITFKGAIQSVKQMGKTMMTVGKAILTNPLFLIGAIITLIVIAVYKFLDSLGLIKKMVDILMWPINKLIELFKELTDWLGLTSHAADAANEKAIAAAKERKAVNDVLYNSLIGDMGREISLMRAQGASIEEIEEKEIELAKVKIKNAKTQMDLEGKKLQATIKSRQILGWSVSEEMKELAALENAYKDFTNELAILDANQNKRLMNERNKETEDRAKEFDKKRADGKKAYEEKLRQQKEFDKQRLMTTRQTEDLITLAIVDDNERNLELNRIKYQRLIEDTLSNEKLLDSEKVKLKALFEAESKRNEDKINEESIKLSQIKEIQMKEEFMSLLLDIDDNQFLRQVANIEKNNEIQLGILKNNLEAGLITKEEFLEAELELERYKEAELKKIAGGEEGLSPIDKLKSDAEAQLLIQQQKLEAGLLNEEEYARRIKEINEKLALDLEAIDKKAFDDKVALSKASVDAASKSFDSVGSLFSAANEAQIAGAEGNEAKQEELRKKGFERSKKMQIGQATIAGIQGVINTMSAPSVIPEPFGTIQKGISAAMLAGVTVANIAKIKATKYGGSSKPSTSTGGGGASGGGGRSLPNINFSGGNDKNTIGAGGSSPDKLSLEVNAVVSETEMTEVQKKNNMREKNAEL